MSLVLYLVDSVMLVGLLGVVVGSLTHRDLLVVGGATTGLSSVLALLILAGHLAGMS